MYCILLTVSFPAFVYSLDAAEKKKSDEKVTQRYINSTLTLMQLAEPNFDTSNGIFAVLNLQNGKLIEQKPLIDDDIMAFKIDAATFADIWQRSL
ncbi:hypothetical protein HMPREF2641_01370 [Lactobacillus sp. HMSC068B07]|nr:hypothetical protein HMPREF2641_01370 [Lactobacillus sp. HMSC068B07]